MTSTIQPVGAVLGLAKEAYLKSGYKDREETAKQIGNLQRCIVGYSKREGFFGNLEGIIYRTWNAVKSIFGQSDWQIAKRELPSLTANYLCYPMPMIVLRSVENDLLYHALRSYSYLGGAEVNSEIKRLFGPPSLRLRANCHGIDFFLKIHRNACEALAKAVLTEQNKESILNFLIKANENEGLKNIFNDPAIGQVFVDPIDTVRSALAFEFIFRTEMVDFWKTWRPKLFTRNAESIMKFYDILKSFSDTNRNMEYYDDPQKVLKSKFEKLNAIVCPIFDKLQTCCEENKSSLEELKKLYYDTTNSLSSVSFDEE